MVANVLVVDDDPDLVEVTSKALEKAGREVMSAPEGAKALQAMRQNSLQSPLLWIS